MVSISTQIFYVINNLLGLPSTFFTLSRWTRFTRSFLLLLLFSFIITSFWINFILICYRFNFLLFYLTLWFLCVVGMGCCFLGWSMIFIRLFGRCSLSRLLWFFWWFLLNRIWLWWFLISIFSILRLVLIWRFLIRIWEI